MFGGGGVLVVLQLLHQIVEFVQGLHHLRRAAKVRGAHGRRRHLAELCRGTEGVTRGARFRVVVTATMVFKLLRWRMLWNQRSGVIMSVLTLLVKRSLRFCVVVAAASSSGRSDNSNLCPAT